MYGESRERAHVFCVCAAIATMETLRHGDLFGLSGEDRGVGSKLYHCRGIIVSTPWATRGAYRTSDQSNPQGNVDVEKVTQDPLLGTGGPQGLDSAPGSPCAFSPPPAGNHAYSSLLLLIL